MKAVNPLVFPFLLLKMPSHNYVRGADIDAATVSTRIM